VNGQGNSFGIKLEGNDDKNGTHLNNYLYRMNNGRLKMNNSTITNLKKNRFT